MPRIVGYGALTAVVLAAYEYTGGSLRGKRKDPEVDEFARKEMLRKNRRRPMEETIAEVGEGRCEHLSLSKSQPMRRPFQLTNIFTKQPSALLDTRNGDEPDSRRSTALTLIP